MEWLAQVAADLQRIDPRNLSRPNQVDLALLRHAVRFQIWQLETLREWSWNPLIYTGLLGDSVQRLLEREFAPRPNDWRTSHGGWNGFPRSSSRSRHARTQRAFRRAAGRRFASNKGSASKSWTWLVRDDPCWTPRAGPRSTGPRHRRAGHRRATNLAGTGTLPACERGLPDRRELFVTKSSPSRCIRR